MNTENYPICLVPPEIAKQLEDIGFDIPLPTWEQAFQWFEAHGYYGNLECTPAGTSIYIFTPFTGNGTSWDFSNLQTYPAARQSLLIKLINLYKITNQWQPTL